MHRLLSLRWSLSFALLLLGPAAARAGTVYVPLPGRSAVGSFGYEAEIVVSNLATVSRSASRFSIPSGTDGTLRTSPAAPLQVAAGRTIVLKPGASFKGLVDLSGATEQRYAAPLAGKGAAGRLGAYVPVIDSDNLARAGTSVALLGLRHEANRTTDVTIVNLAHVARQCTVTVSRSDGAVIIGPSLITLPPLSHRLFQNIFAGVAPPGGLRNARAVVSCGGDFYAFAQLFDTASGEIAFVGPAASGTSLLAVPGPLECPVGAICLDAPGIVHQPTPTTPVGRVSFDAPAGTFTHLKLSIEVTVGPFFPSEPAAKHLVYWWVINRNFNMPGMLFFRGPGAHTALVRHGIGLTHPEKHRIEQPFAAIPGHTYRIENEYDMGRGIFSVVITDLDTGLLAARLDGAPNVSQVTLTAADKFLVDMGFPEAVIPDEAPSYGWTYRNVHIEVSNL